MRYAILVSAIVAAIFCAGSPAVANGYKLYEYCKSDTPVLRAFCTSYLAGWEDAFYTATTKLEHPKNFISDSSNMICLPTLGSSNVEKMRIAVNKYFRDDPEALHKSKMGVLLSAMLKYFPCSAEWRSGFTGKVKD
jgi:hypothetical protein